jgi:DNA-binding transcriptional LysR family regulator
MSRKAGAVAKKTKKLPVRWAPAPAEHDYPAADSFLRLIAGADLIQVCTGLLSQAPTVHQHAKDILRAAGLPLLSVDDSEVARDLKNVSKGVALSPILLVRGDISSGRALQIADGYHRVCASYHVNENTDIPCRLIRLPADASRSGPGPGDQQ